MRKMDVVIHCAERKGLQKLRLFIMLLSISLITPPPACFATPTRHLLRTDREPQPTLERGFLNHCVEKEPHEFGWIHSRNEAPLRLALFEPN